MAYFPFYVELKDVSVLIVGGGKVALHKVKRILDYGPKIKVVAKKVDERIKNIKGVEWEEREFEDSDVEGVRFVIAAAGDEELDEHITSLCNDTGAIKCTGTEVTVDYSKCNNCGRCVKSCPTDAWEGKSGYIVSFGGLFGNHIYKGETILPLITDEDTLFRVTDAAIGFFEKNANPGERFRLLLQRVGEDEFRKEIQAAYKGQK